MRCLGRKNGFKRCRNEQKFPFCRHHTWQPIGFLVGTLLIPLLVNLSSSFIYEKISYPVERIKHEESTKFDDKIFNTNDIIDSLVDSRITEFISINKKQNENPKREFKNNEKTRFTYKFKGSLLNRLIRKNLIQPEKFDYSNKNPDFTVEIKYSNSIVKINNEDNLYFYQG